VEREYPSADAAAGRCKAAAAAPPPVRARVVPERGPGGRSGRPSRDGGGGGRSCRSRGRGDRSPGDRDRLSCASAGAE
ncbi:unnamed protein product, partial [Prorocentrum cordatum]